MKSNKTKFTIFKIALFFFALSFLSLSDNGKIFAAQAISPQWAGVSVTNTNTLTAPGVGVAIATIASSSLPLGNYEILLVVGYGATAGVINNMELRKGATVIGSLYVPAVANREAQAVIRRVTVDGTQSISVNATAAAGAGEVYNAWISATRIN